MSLESQVKNIICNIPSGYNKQTQLTKEPTLKAFSIAIDSIKMMQLITQTLKINKAKCEKACTPELFTTDHAYELVKKGMPFRQAYITVSKNLDKLVTPNLGKALKKSSH
ncbi:MAG: argininosuccinate lyase, partial [Candidatus Woesearchaeota archaeon]